MEPLLIKPGEAAELLGVSRSTIYQLLGSGEVPSVRVGKLLRVPAAALEQWVRERSIGTASRDDNASFGGL